MDQRTLEEAAEEQLHVFLVLPHHIQAVQEDDLQGDVSDYQ
jgi:hypothetical protein